jgi:4-amino-4-deoxy-L-arabinose transferase-like glycosyltransferase
MILLRELFSEKKIPYTLFAFALAAHLVVFYALLYFYGPCSFFLSNDCGLNGNDTQHYVILAENMTHGHGYSRFLDAPFEPDALRTPLLPLYFAPFTYFAGYSLIWIAILLLNIVLAVAAPVVYKLARFFVGHPYARVAGLVMAFEPLYLYRSQIAEPDALLVLLIFASIFFIIRSWYRDFAPDIYRAAFLLGLAILAKPNALYLALIIFIFQALYFLAFRKNRAKEWTKNLAVSVLITCAMISPWVVRNTIVFEVPALSSIQGYNLYEYYTKNIKLPQETVPEEMQKESREPSRYLPFQSYFTHVAFERIRAQPSAYIKEQLVGMLRNAFVSDISQIYYYGHTRLLPFPYDPESRINIHELLLAGDMRGFIRAFFSGHVFPKVLWIVFLAAIYCLAVMGWMISWWRDRKAFLAFTMFFCLYGFLLVASGPFVDAKYRMPALMLVSIIALYGAASLWSKYALRLRAN